MAGRKIRSLCYISALMVLFIQGSTNLSFGRGTDSLSLITEGGWIEKMDHKIAFELSLNNDFETFEVKTQTDKLLLSPNSISRLRLKVNYRFISAALVFAPGFISGNKDNDIKGKTKSFGLGTSVIFSHWLFMLSYSSVKGYYLENSEDFQPMSPGDPFIQFPDLHYKGFEISTAYSSNSRFSFRHLTSQTERQLKSAGSFVPYTDIRYYIIDDKSQGTTSQKSNSFESCIGPGYIYTFVTRKSIYTSVGLMAEAGYLNTKLTTRFPYGDIITHQDNFIFRWQGKAGVGYNGSKFYSGLYATLSGTRYNQENTTVMNYETRVFYHLFFGIRITSPRFVKENVNKIEEKIPF